MKKIFFLLQVFFVCHCYGQAKLDKKVKVDFMHKVQFNFFYGNDLFKATVNNSLSLKGYDYTKTNLMMSKFDENEIGWDYLLEEFHELLNQTEIHDLLIGIGISIERSWILIDYMNAKWPPEPKLEIIKDSVITNYPPTIPTEDWYSIYCNDSLKKCFRVSLSRVNIEISNYEGNVFKPFFIGKSSLNSEIIIDTRKGYGISDSYNLSIKLGKGVLWVSYDKKNYIKFIQEIEKHKNDKH